MPKKLTFPALAFLLLASTLHAQESTAVIDRAASAMGASRLRSIQYSGSGSQFALGQNINPNVPWPRFNLKSYTRQIDYETASSREDLVRTQGENPPRGGGGQPLAGEQRQILVVSGNSAWNVAGSMANAAPAAAAERQLQLWMTPHGVLKAAAAGNASVRSRGKSTTLTFTKSGTPVTATINSEGLVERVEARLANTVLGDMLVETTYSDYRDFDGVKFPARILQKQGGFPTLDLTVSRVEPNAKVEITVPENVRQATATPVRVESQKLADGSWYLTGGSHHSVLVEFRDHVLVIEGPLSEERSLAVISEVKRLVPGKPIRYLLNTHHHFDHSGGIRAYAAEGARILTHEVNRKFYEQALRAPRKLSPDQLSRSGKKARLESIRDKHVLTDGVRTVEIYHIRGNPHHDGIVMAYLPGEKSLVLVDVFTPAPAGAPAPQTPNAASVNLYENIERLGLVVDRIVPLHGRVVPMAELKKAVGKAKG